MPRDVFEWKYIGHPHGEPIAWTISEAMGRPWVGGMILQPRRFRYRGRNFLAGQLVDLMVDPAYRRRGIFSGITRRIRADHRMYGFDMIFTVPTTAGMSVGGFRSMPYLVQVGALRSYRRFWRVREPLARRLRSRWAAAAVAPLARAWLRSKDRIRAEPVPVRVGEPFALARDGLVTDVEWMRWRLRSPGRHVESIAWDGGGALVVREGDTATMYCLGLGDRPESALSGLMRYLELQGVSAAHLEAFVEPATEALLRRAGFLPARGQPSLVCFAGSDDPLLDFRTGRGMWPVYRGDLDVP